MPTTKAAAKGLRQGLTRAKRNARAKATLEVAIRAFRKAAALGEETKANEAYRAVVRLTDKAAGRGIVPKNRAARIKSRLAKHLNTPKSAR